MQIRQITLVLKHVPGSLRRVVRLLEAAHVSMLAVSLNDVGQDGAMRFVLRSADFARAITTLHDGGYQPKIDPVLCVRVPNRPLAFTELLAQIERDTISVEYLYFFRAPAVCQSLMVLCPSDPARCVVALAESGVEMISQEKLDRLFDS